MAVYIDDYNATYGRMLMCHMIADTEEELDAMADKLGLKREWKQPSKGKRPPHYDVCLEFKWKAISHFGAIPISSHELVKKFPSY